MHALLDLSPPPRHGGLTKLRREKAHATLAPAVRCDTVLVCAAHQPSASCIRSWESGHGVSHFYTTALSSFRAAFFELKSQGLTLCRVRQQHSKNPRGAVGGACVMRYTDYAYAYKKTLKPERRDGGQIGTRHRSSPRPHLHREASGLFRHQTRYRSREVMCDTGAALSIGVHAPWCAIALHRRWRATRPSSFGMQG